MPKKSASKKSLREQQQAQRQSMFKQMEAGRKAQQLSPEKADTHVEKKTPIKTSAKAAGLKSTFILNEDELLMTAFGDGNKAIIEKRIKNNVVRDIAEKPTLHVRPDGNRLFSIDGRVFAGATADNPLYTPPEKPLSAGMDLIHAKEVLEKRFYGQTFTDNIHIQAIYNILDVEKILVPHINNIIYQLNNMLRNKGRDFQDFIGRISFERAKTFDKLKANGSTEVNSVTGPTAAQELYRAMKTLSRNGTIGYYNLEIDRDEEEQIEWEAHQEKLKAEKEAEGKEYTKPQPDPNTLHLTYEKFYQILCILGEVRQSLAHGKEPEYLYRTDDMELIPQSAKETIQELYSSRVHQLNAKFLSMAKSNLIMLFRAFDVTTVEEKKKYVQAYYDFIVRKKYKNLGFSIRKLRETIIQLFPEAERIADDQYSTIRNKLYSFFDFAIFSCYKNNEAVKNDLVARLRACQTEEAKESIYQSEAKTLWPRISNLVLKHILPETIRITRDEYKDLFKKQDKDVNKSMLDDIRVSEEAQFFTAVVYIMTFFLDGKEINDLITQLIHKFESIGSFMDVLQAEGLPHEVCDRYELFNKSWQVAEELRIMNNFARMAKPAAHAKPIMFRDALSILGYNKMTEKEIDQYIKQMMDADQSNEGVLRRGIRNFIANNVIESSRFKYIVRYSNVNKVKGLMENREVVSFVLQYIPDEQIRRYYKSVTGNDVSFDKSMRGFLADMLTGFSFEDIRNVRQNEIGATPEEKEEKKKKIALVRLYLTILYLIVKNLVYINSRYFLAFHCVERDRLLLDEEYWSQLNNNNSNEPRFNYTVFARSQLEKYPPKPRVQEYMKKNAEYSDDWAIRVYRNKIDHLEAVRNADTYLKVVLKIESWYKLYHYIMQRTIIDQYNWYLENGTDPKSEMNPKTFEYFAKIQNYKTCCLDFIKALNMPFAYNLPRYKNLSIDGLFDRNRPETKKKGDGKKLEHDE